MSEAFCEQCGSKLPAEARFCVDCGQSRTGPVRSKVVPSALSLGRFAPALIFGAVIAAVGIVVLVGRVSAPPPAHVRGGAQPPAEGKLPPGHPSLDALKHMGEQIKTLRSRADAAPEDLAAWRALGKALSQQAQFDSKQLGAAAAAYQHILDRSPKDAESLRMLGNIAYDQRKPEAAAGYYRRYLTEHPDDLNVMTDLGTMLLSAGKVEHAVTQFEKVLRKDPKFFQAQFNLTFAYRELGKVDEAMAALKRAREIAPDDAARARMDQFLKQISEQTTAAEAAPAGGADFKVGVEAIFRRHPIMGSKITSIEWPNGHLVKVTLHDFPVQGMPPAVREKFSQRIKSELRRVKGAAGVTDPVRVELVDATQGTVMVTVSE